MNPTVSSESSTNFTFVIPFKPIEALALTLTVYPLAAFGIIANFVTIVTIQKSPNLKKSTWNQLIISLSTSDLLSAMISPIYFNIFTWGYVNWNWPEFLCKLAYGVDAWTSYVTTLHILWFSILRYISLQWPHQFKTFTANYGKKSIVVIWVISTLAGFIPSVIMMRAVSRDRTKFSPFVHWGSCGGSPEWVFAAYWFFQFAYPVFFYMPLVLTTCFSVKIGIKIFALRKKRNRKIEQGGSAKEGELNRRKKENQIVVQLALIVGSFMLGYIPNTVVYLWVFGGYSTNDTTVLSWRSAVGAHIMLRISECLNPIFYNLASSEMRRETMAMLKTFGKKIGCPIKENGNATVADDVSGTVETRV